MPKRDSEMKKGARFRKSLIIPAEHGSWSWLLVPFGVGTAVARRLDGPVLLVLLGSMSAFLLRQPATAWLRIRQGRGRRADESLAAQWTIGLAVVSLLSLLGLVALGRTFLLWLLPPLSGIFLVYLAVAQIGRARVRSLWMEVAGAAGLAAAAPASYAAASGRLDQTAWLLWGLMAAQNALGVLYVRLRLADTHGRESRRARAAWAHALALIMWSAASWGNIVPWPIIVPFAGFFARAVWAVAGARPISNIKRFGFTEIGVEVASGLWIVGTFLVSPN